jgi:hypothetical protein
MRGYASGDAGKLLLRVAILIQLQLANESSPDSSRYSPDSFDCRPKLRTLNFRLQLVRRSFLSHAHFEPASPSCPPELYRDVFELRRERLEVGFVQRCLGCSARRKCAKLAGRGCEASEEIAFGFEA